MDERPTTRSRRKSRVASLLLVARRQWRAAFVVLAMTLLAAAGYLLLTTPLFTAQSRVRVEQVGPRAIGEQPKPVEPVTTAFLNTEGAVLTCTPVLALALSDPEVSKSATLSGQANPIDFLKKHLLVTVGRTDELITLEYDAPSREEAIAIVKSVVDAYIAYHGKQTKERSAKLVGAIAEQKTECLRQLKTINDQILSVKAQAGTASFDNDRDDNARRQLAKLNDALTTARLDARSAKVACDEALAAYGTDPKRQAELAELRKAQGPITTSDLDYAQVRESIVDTERRLNALRREYMPSHPSYQVLEQRLDGLRATYVIANERRWAAAQQVERDLETAFKAQQQAASEYAKLAAEASNLERERTRIEAEAAKLEQRITEVRVETAAGPLNIQVQEDADAAASPTKPVVGRTMLMALGVGLVLAIITATARHRIRPRIYSAEDVTEMLALPLLGVVPQVSARHTDATRAQEARLNHSSEAAEAFRTVRLSLQYRAQGSALRTMLVTSPGSHDGSSTVASNLAITLARSGKRILLVDANFRHPMQHSIWGCDNQLGLSGVLEGEELDSAVAGTAVDGLSLLPSGPAPHEPIELLNSDRFAETLALMQTRYDQIILDSPPAASTNDTRVIAATVDGVLLVVRAGKTSRHLSELACDGLLSVGGRLLGAVLNDSPTPSTMRPPPPPGESPWTVATASADLSM